MGIVDRVALITGATSGIGEETAKHFAANGARVVVAGRDVERGGAVVSAIEAAGGEATYIAHDLKDPDGGARLVSEVEAAYGVPDILIANAGTFFFGPTPAVTVEEFDMAIRVNVFGTFQILQALLPRMAERDYGRVVIVGSSGASYGVAMLSLYAMTKGALKGLMYTLVPEWGPSHITLNLIEPGLVVTPLTEPMVGTPELREAFLPHQPTGRVGVALDIAHTALMLADDNAGHINAQTIVVDGGNTRTAKHSALPPPPDKL